MSEEISKEELAVAYTALSTNELLEIIDNKFSYTETAIQVAMQEITRRNLSRDDLANYKNYVEQKVTRYIEANIKDDLNIWQKILFFFAFIPIIPGALRANFRDDGYALKLQQSRYYTATGIAALFMSILLEVALQLPDYSSLLLFCLCFLLAYYYDERFNRDSNIKKLQAQYSAINEQENIQDEDHNNNVRLN